MHLFNPFKPHIVKIKDNYHIRALSKYLFFKYLDIECILSDDELNWFSDVTKCSYFKTIKEAEHNYNNIYKPNIKVGKLEKLQTTFIKSL